MDLFNILAVLITLTAIFSYINHRYIGLPVTIGVMLIALLFSLLLNLLGIFGLGLKQYAEMLLAGIDFDKTLLHGMLSFLLFAGALHINIEDLLERNSTVFNNCAGEHHKKAGEKDCQRIMTLDRKLIP